MKILMTSAALIALALTAPVQGQVLGGGNAGVGSTSGLTGQVGTAPLGAGATVGAGGQVNGPPNVGTPILPGDGAKAQGAVNGAAGATPDVIKDGRTLSTGSSVDASANVSESGARSQALLAGGMNIQDMGGMALGKVVSVTKSRGGQVTNVIIQTADGVRRSMPAAGLTVKGGTAVTSQSEADLVALPALR